LIVRALAKRESDPEQIADLAAKVFSHGLPQQRDSRPFYVGAADPHGLLRQGRRTSSSTSRVSSDMKSLVICTAGSPFDVVTSGTTAPFLFTWSAAGVLLSDGGPPDGDRAFDLPAAAVHDRRPKV
jgi:hypothetical protein